MSPGQEALVGGEGLESAGEACVVAVRGKCQESYVPGGGAVGSGDCGCHVVIVVAVRGLSWEGGGEEDRDGRGGISAIN